VGLHHPGIELEGSLEIGLGLEHGTALEVGAPSVYEQPGLPGPQPHRLLKASQGIRSEPLRPEGQSKVPLERGGAERALRQAVYPGKFLGFEGPEDAKVEIDGVGVETVRCREFQ
jgi:hypothetical protein